MLFRSNEDNTVEQMLIEAATQSSWQYVKSQDIPRSSDSVLVESVKFCVQKGLGGAALNKQTVGNVSVYKHSHCLPDLCVDSHTHCLPHSKTAETALVPLRKIN